MSLPAPLTKPEQLAITSLHRLAKHWPKSLWLYSAGGSLCVMKKADGHRAIIPGTAGANSPGGGMDPEFVVGTADIENDGGDW